MVTSGKTATPMLRHSRSTPCFSSDLDFHILVCLLFLGLDSSYMENLFNKEFIVVLSLNALMDFSFS